MCRTLVRPLALLMLAIAPLVSPPPAAARAELAPELSEKLQHLPAGERLPIIVTMAEQVDLARHARGRAGAGALIVDLEETANRSQAPVIAALERLGFRGRVQQFWIQNCLILTATAEIIGALTTLPEVERIEMDVTGGAPDEGGGGERSTGWNLDLIGAPAIWSTYGLDGSGIVVGSMDTGIDTNHPALAGKWRGGSNSWRDIVNGLPNPYDDHGHGTHTIGTMVGGDGPGPFVDDIGIAYNAKVISVKVLDANNSFSSASVVISGAQWILDPDANPNTNDFPDVVNNSWYFNSQTFTGFYASVAAWRAAGIIPVGIVANFGPGASTTRPPGNYNNIFGVGATTSSDQVASFSSRGPSPAGSSFPPDQHKPDFSAPGDLVRSSLPGGGYQSWSGTSMAAPHVAGTVALLLQADPNLIYDDIWGLIVVSAVDVAAPGYDFDSGYGRLNAFAAVELVAGTLAVAEAPSAGPSTLRTSPNPFHDQVTIELARPVTGLRLEILDVQGRRLRRLSTTDNAYSWDGRDEEGRPMPAWAYFVHAAGSGVKPSTGRLILLR